MKCVWFGGMDEFGKFMFVFYEFEFVILREEECFDFVIKLFESFVLFNKVGYILEIYY